MSLRARKFTWDKFLRHNETAPVYDRGGRYISMNYGRLNVLTRKTAIWARVTTVVGQ